MKQREKSSEYLTKSELAQELSTSERTVNNLLNMGLPHYRLGRKILRFKRTEIEDWMKQFRAEAESRVDAIVNEVLR